MIMKRLAFTFLLAFHFYAHASVTDSIAIVKDCEAPQNLIASLVDGSFKLTWDVVEGALYYEMYHTYTYWNNNFNLGATLTETTYQGDLYWPWAENSYYVVAYFEDGSECASDTVSLGPEALDFVATDLQGNEVHLYEILDHGQYVFMDFFHYTCGPCREIIPYIEESYYYYGCNDKDVFYMEISGYDDDNWCQQWCEEFAVDYPTISKSRGGDAIRNEFRIPADPFVILIAPDHSIVLQSWGYDFGYEGINSLQSIVDAFTPFGIEHNQCDNGFVGNSGQLLGVFPNPADGFATISATGLIRVYNSLGQLMDLFVSENEQVRIETGNYPEGLYFVQVDGKGFGKFIVRH